MKTMIDRAATSLLGGIVTAAVLGMSGAAHASNTLPELRHVERQIERLLPGEYDAYPQIHVQRLLGAPPDGEHDHWHRVFQRIDVPQFGEKVYYGQMRMGSRDGAIVQGTQVLYTLLIDEENMSVTLSGRRIANGEEFEDAHLHPEMWPSLELDPRYGGTCTFRWRMNGDQVVGRLEEDGTCTHTSRVTGQTYTWDAEWVLTDEELWIFDNGYLEDGTMFLGRHDRVHHRLSRTRDFSCQATDAAGGSEDFVLHDRGETRLLANGAAEVKLLRANLPIAGSDFLVEQTRLLLQEAGEDGVIAETNIKGRTDHISLVFPGTALHCRAL